MDYDKLDNEELLRLSLGAMNAGRDADALVMLKTLLAREPGHAHAQYLLAAQHAQLGMLDRAEEGFRKLLATGAELPPARFQFSQLLLMKGAGQEAQSVLAPLVSKGDALGAYARALSAAAGNDLDAAVSELQAGLELPQDIPALTADMRRLSEQFSALLSDGDGAGSAGVDAAPAVPGASLFLTQYGREI